MRPSSGINIAEQVEVGTDSIPRYGGRDTQSGSDLCVHSHVNFERQEKGLEGPFFDLRHFIFFFFFFFLPSFPPPLFHSHHTHLAPTSASSTLNLQRPFFAHHFHRYRTTSSSPDNMLSVSRGSLLEVDE